MNERRMGSVSLYGHFADPSFFNVTLSPDGKIAYASSTTTTQKVTDYNYDDVKGAVWKEGWGHYAKCLLPSNKSTFNNFTPTFYSDIDWSNSNSKTSDGYQIISNLTPGSLNNCINFFPYVSQNNNPQWFDGGKAVFLEAKFTAIYIPNNVSITVSKSNNKYSLTINFTSTYTYSLSTANGSATVSPNNNLISLIPDNFNNNSDNQEYSNLNFRAKSTYTKIKNSMSTSYDVNTPSYTNATNYDLYTQTIKFSTAYIVLGSVSKSGNSYTLNFANGTKATGCLYSNSASYSTDSTLIVSNVGSGVTRVDFTPGSSSNTISNLTGSGTYYFRLLYVKATSNGKTTVDTSTTFVFPTYSNIIGKSS